MLDKAGVTINGSEDYDIQVHNENLYRRVLQQGTLGLGEAYMEKWWDCVKLDEFFYRVLSADLEKDIKYNWDILLKLAGQAVLNTGRKSKAFDVGEKHYDAGNDLYRTMLDKRLTYTCGYWPEAGNLDEAQEAKLDLICRKLDLKPGQKILDIGSGWGSFIGYAAEKYGVTAVGTTVSKEQKELADKLYADLPVETRLEDYREMREKFDHVVSIGMFEHVGYKNYRLFMKVAHDSLKDDGLFLLHTIGGRLTHKTGDPWFDKYIFPNSMLPSVKQIGGSIEGLFIMEDWHNFGSDYDKTLMAWDSNFESGWDELKSNYNDKFYRMWKFYLMSSAGMFRSRRNQLWQVVLSKDGVRGGYRRV